jgi:hypothetical protein
LYLKEYINNAWYHERQKQQQYEHEHEYEYEYEYEHTLGQSSATLERLLLQTKQPIT